METKDKVHLGKPLAIGGVAERRLSQESDAPIDAVEILKMVYSSGDRFDILNEGGIYNAKLVTAKHNEA